MPVPYRIPIAIYKHWILLTYTVIYLYIIVSTKKSNKSRSSNVSSMPKVQITISLDKKFLDWLDEGIKSLKFASRSHGIEYCINQTMNQDLR